MTPSGAAIPVILNQRPHRKSARWLGATALMCVLEAPGIASVLAISALLLGSTGSAQAGTGSIEEYIGTESAGDASVTIENQRTTVLGVVHNGQENFHDSSTAGSVTINNAYGGTVTFLGVFRNSCGSFLANFANFQTGLSPVKYKMCAALSAALFIPYEV